jgi:hypothetical protein
MPSTTANPNAAAASQRATIRALSQAVCAELIDRPASWLRDNANRAHRNADGSYDAQALVASLLKTQPVAVLSDDLFEGMKQVVECISPNNDRFDIALAALEAVVERHGTAGASAIGMELIKELRLWCQLDPFARPRELPVEENYVADAVAVAEREARERWVTINAGWTARQQGKLLFVCSKCHRYRMGTKWLSPPLPVGYVPHNLGRTCDKCRG